MPLFRLRTRGPEDLPYVQDGSAQNLVQDAGIFGQGWLFGRPDAFCQNATKTRGEAKGLFGVWVRVKIRPRGSVGLGRHAKLKLTTRVLRKVLCRPVLHIAKAGVEPLLGHS